MPEPDGTIAERFAAMGWPHPLREQQREALTALDAATSEDRRRSWVVLPPGAGKTVVGLEAARRRGRRIVVFSPNTAIQGQWVREWHTFTPAVASAGTGRDLTAPLTSLTYQSLATFDPDAEVDEEGHGKAVRRRRHRRTGTDRHQSLLDQLHANGRALVDELHAAGPLTIVLDECHHLLEVWGKLLAELLDDLAEAYVIGLTATPRQTMTAEQAELSDELFGDPVYTCSIPAVVRSGHLAPFGELAYLVRPTPTESDWLAAETERFLELRTELYDPAFASIGFAEWMHERFVDRDSVDSSGQRRVVPLPVSWSRLERDRPALAAAALRFHHGGLLTELPPGARLREEHRHPPTAEDWVELLDDYVKGTLAKSDNPRDEHAYEALRKALPSIGYRLTRAGIRAGRSPVDRVVARSEAKTHAAREIIVAEGAELGDRLRALVLCDHERAAATLPARLVGVLDADAGSARLMLRNLLDDPRTAAHHPMLVTARTVAASAGTAAAFVDFCARTLPGVQLTVTPPDSAGIARVEGGWSSRRWVPAVTRFFESGGARVLVGTRALLGEGWNAQRINTLVDATTATSATAVVQTRGRALRIDPSWPEKVANNWTLVCLTEDHPKGTADWDRFVRKHEGYLGVTEAGDITDGVAHVDPAFSPFVPPPTDSFDEVNAAMLARAAERHRIRDLWRVGTPYRDELVHAVRVTGRRTTAAAEHVPTGVVEPPVAVPGERGISWRSERPRVLPTLWQLPRIGDVVAGCAAPPDLLSFAHVVADALRDAVLSERGAEAITVSVDRRAAAMVALSGASVAASRHFATALDELLAPITTPRYVIPRYVAASPDRLSRWRLGWRCVRDRLPANVVTYHAVPTVFGEKAAMARIFTAAWNRWISAGTAAYTGSPEGEGIVLTHRSHEPLDLTTALRVAWE